MAEVYLWSDNGQEIIDLPPVCMKCGAPATVRKRKLFLWTAEPSIKTKKMAACEAACLAILLTIFFPWWELLVAVILLRRQRVQMPFCDRHESYWWRFPILLCLSFLAMAVFDMLAGLGTALALRRNGENLDLSFAGIVAGFVGLTLGIPHLLIVLVILIMNRRIRPVKITNQYVHLTEVSPLFAEAVAKQQTAQTGKESHPT